MDWVTFISKAIDSLAWPVFALIVILLLRKPIMQLIPLMSKLKYRDFEAEFAQGVQQLKEEVGDALPEATLVPADREISEDRLYNLAEIAPNGAVLEGWKLIEHAAKNLISARGHDLDYDVSTPYRLIERVLDKGDLIDKPKVAVFNELRRLRNKVAHAGEFEISSIQAKAYVTLALRLVAYLESKTNDPMPG